MEAKILDLEELNTILKDDFYNYYLPALLEMFYNGLVDDDSLSSHEIDKYIESLESNE